MSLLSAGWSVLFLVIAACSDARPVRLTVGRSDTVIVNSRGLVPLAVRVVNADGVERVGSGVHYRLVSRGDIQLADGGRITCDRPGNAEVEATYRDLSMRLTVLCRPIEGFSWPRQLRLTIGGPAVPLGAAAIGVDGKSVDMVAGTASVRDSLIVALVDGLVHARARGETMVDVEAGGCAVSIPVEVIEPSSAANRLLPNQVYAESLSMAAGELRSWRLPPGRYEIGLSGDDGALAHLRLASHQMDCAARRGSELQFSCIAKEQASVIVQQTQQAGRGGQSTGALLVHRRGDLGSDAGLSRRAVHSKCPLFG
jgi:hypothetical protein